jgi:hypothetical protein
MGICHAPNHNRSLDLPTAGQQPRSRAGTLPGSSDWSEGPDAQHRWRQVRAVIAADAKMLTFVSSFIIYDHAKQKDYSHLFCSDRIQL